MDLIVRPLFCRSWTEFYRCSCLLAPLLSLSVCVSLLLSLFPVCVWFCSYIWLPFYLPLSLLSLLSPPPPPPPPSAFPNSPYPPAPAAVSNLLSPCCLSIPPFPLTHPPSLSLSLSYSLPTLCVSSLSCWCSFISSLPWSLAWATRS